METQLNEFAQATVYYASHIVAGAKQANQRTGQWMYNILPNGPGRAVSGTLFDPFHKDYNAFEICKWIENHLIFDKNQIVAVFDNNNILWEGRES